MFFFVFGVGVFIYDFVCVLWFPALEPSIK